MMGKYPIIAEQVAASRKADTGFIVSMLLLCGLGLTSLYSGSGSYALRIFGDQLYFVKRQLVLFAVGFAGMAILSFINLQLIRRVLPLLVIGSLVLCLLVFAPVIGVEKNGAHRWILVPGTTFQPSELAKMVLVLFLANLFAKKYDRIDDMKVTLGPAIIMLALFFTVVIIQNDFSTSVFILCIGLLMFFIAGVKMRWFIALLIVGIPLVVLFVFEEPYRLERIVSYLRPELDPQGASYQAMASRAALTSGGFWGRGLGGGIRKISGIPEVQADFIFAGWAEEMGFFGVILYFILLCYFAWCGYRIALRCSDRFGCYVAFGAVSILFLQSLVNCGVVCGLLPPTGIPLPFFSSGGSSLVISLCLCGLIINVSRCYSGQEKSNE